MKKEGEGTDDPSGSKTVGVAGDEDEEDDEGMVPHVLNPIGDQS